MFHSVAYKAKKRSDLLAGIDEFLDQVRRGHQACMAFDFAKIHIPFNFFLNGMFPVDLVTSLVL